MKPTDSMRDFRRKQANSMAELREMKREEAKYNKFMQESVNDTAFDKEIDDIIDEKIASGKSNDEILNYIGGLTGLGPE